MRPTQDEVLAWLEHRFGTKRDLERQHLKLMEEVLELGDAVDGVLGLLPIPTPAPPEGWKQNLKDEVADCMIVLIAIAGTEGFDLEEAVADKWKRRKSPNE